MDIELDLNTVDGCLSLFPSTLPAKDIIFCTPKNFKAIDFLAEIDRVDLPDRDDAHSTVLAIQVTIQLKNRKRKSIVGDISCNKNVIFFLINPSWEEFDANYEAAVEATSGAAAADFSNFWYGQPDDFAKFKGLYNAMFK